MINHAALYQLNHYTTILPLHSMSHWLVDYICAKLIDWWKWVILTAYWVLAHYKHCSSLLFMINMQKTSEVDELQAPCCYSYFSSQDEFLHIKPRTCSTAIIHEAQQAHSWSSVGMIPIHAVYEQEKLLEWSKKWKRKRTKVLHKLNLLKRKRERQTQARSFNFIEQYIDSESQWGSRQTAENAIFHYRDLMLFTERWYAYGWRDANMREKLAEISHIDKYNWMNCLSNIYFLVWWNMILCAEKPKPCWASTRLESFQPGFLRNINTFVFFNILSQPIDSDNANVLLLLRTPQKMNFAAQYDIFNVFIQFETLAP